MTKDQLKDAIDKKINKLKGWRWDYQGTEDEQLLKVWCDAQTLCTTLVALRQKNRGNTNEDSSSK